MNFRLQKSQENQSYLVFNSDEIESIGYVQAGTRHGKIRWFAFHSDGSQQRSFYMGHSSIEIAADNLIKEALKLREIRRNQPDFETWKRLKYPINIREFELDGKSEWVAYIPLLGFSACSAIGDNPTETLDRLEATRLRLHAHFVKKGYEISLPPDNSNW